LALAIPLNIPNKSVHLAYIFEANYIFPPNNTIYPPIIQRNGARSDNDDSKNSTEYFPGVSRQLVYNAIEAKISS